MFQITKKSYYKAFEKFNINPKDVIFVSDDENDRNISNHTIDEYNFLHDFFLLKNAKHIFRSNSSFSFWASVFSENSITYSPVVIDKPNGLHDVEFEIGNHNIMCSFEGFIKNNPECADGVDYPG